MSDAPKDNRQSGPKTGLLILLSVCLVFFLADAAISLLDDTLIVSLGIHLLGAIRGVVFGLSLLAAFLVYLLLGVSPMVPKRFFLPVTLFNPVAMLLAIPLFIYHYAWVQQIAWVISFGQVILALGILYGIQGGFRLRWPIVREEQLGPRLFGWLNLSGFVLANVFVLLPGVLLYLALCASMALDHFSGSFLAMHSGSLTMQARKYVRSDGKTVQLIPMMHIGESDFYDQISKSFPTNSVILMEGVTDTNNLLKYRLSYKRMATSLGLAEQRETFAPPQSMARPADVDVAQFSARTIEYLNLVTLLYSQGLHFDVIFQLIEKSEDPLLTQQLWEDLLLRRNEHLLKEIQAELLHADMIVVPWGAAHMPALAHEIEKSGFHPSEAREYKLVYFRTIWKGLLHSYGK